MRRFAFPGFGVVGNGHNSERLAAMENEIGAPFRGVAGDASDTNVLEQLFLAALERFGKPADIVIIGSVAERQISPFSAVYDATKFAVHSLAEALRRELAPKGVQVTLVEPGIVISGFQKGAGYSDEMVDGFDERYGPLLEGDDIANAIHYVVTQPPHVHVSDIIVRPNRQDYP